MVLKLIQPYTRIRIPFVSQQLNIPEADVEQLLVMLILDNRINGHIDQVREPPAQLCGGRSIDLTICKTFHWYRYSTQPLTLQSVYPVGAVMSGDGHLLMARR